MTPAKISPLFCRFTLSTQWKLHQFISNLLPQHVLVFWLCCWLHLLVISFRNCAPPYNKRLQLNVRRDTGCTLRLLQVREQRFSSLRWAERKSSQWPSWSVDHLTWLAVIRRHSVKLRIKAETAPPAVHELQQWITIHSVGDFALHIEAGNNFFSPIGSVSDLCFW